MNIIKFKKDTSFRKDLFTPDSFSHPAKMDAQLLLWIVEMFTAPGETILDPMFGSGTTMLACILGRNVIGVELEQKFVDMAKANWEKVKQKPQLGYSMGDCQILQGDARNLSGLLADAVLSSPPYIAQTSTSKQTEGLFKGRQLFKDGRDPQQHSKGQIGDLPYGQIDSVITSPPYAETIHQGSGEWSKSPNGKMIGIPQGEAYTKSDSNIANLPYGQIDSVITSPPFGEAHDKDPGGITKTNRKDLLPYSYLKDGSPNNISNLSYGDIDTVITSPPYEEAMGEKHHSPRADKLAEEKSNPVTYTDRVDHIITSPPYEGSLQGESHNGLKDAEKLEELTKRTPNRKWKRKTELTPGRMRAWGTMGLEYSPNQDNIGNLKSTSYLEAMAQVYAQCYAVLKPEGLMVLVVKNFIRDQKEVRLDLDTIKLCEQSGFSFQERWYRELPAQSFWRVIYKKKYPSAPELKYEDILVFKKVI